MPVRVFRTVFPQFRNKMRQCMHRREEFESEDTRVQRVNQRSGKDNQGMRFDFKDIFLIRIRTD